MNTANIGHVRGSETRSAFPNEWLQTAFPGGRRYRLGRFWVIIPRPPSLLFSLLIWSVLACVLSFSKTSAASRSLLWGGESPRWKDVLAEKEWLAVTPGGHHTLALTQSGSLRVWGDNHYGQWNTPPGDNYTVIAAGRYHSLALRRDGSLVVWGGNRRGQCLAPTGKEFVAIGAGDWHCLAIQSDGTLLAWGWNEYGQCDVPANKTCTAVCGGHSHSLALTREGTVVAWGSNTDGQCDVPAGDNFIAIAAGAFHNIALHSDGSLMTWGRNDYGACDIPCGRDFVAVAAGAFHSLALRADGTVAAWGHNVYGQCDVQTDRRIASIAAGGYASLAVPVGLTADSPADQREPMSVPTTVAHVSSELASHVNTTISPAIEGGDAISVNDSSPVEAPAVVPPARRLVRDRPLEETTAAEKVLALVERDRRASVARHAGIGVPSINHHTVGDHPATSLAVAILPFLLVHCGYPLVALSVICLMTLRRGRKERAKKRQVHEKKGEIPEGLILVDDLQQLCSD